MMLSRKPLYLLAAAFASASSMYLLAAGATWLGVTEQTTALLSLVLFTLMVIGWLWRRGSAAWHRTALDPLLPLVALALAISSAGNLDAWRQIGSGLWFLGAYGIVWYVVQDALANGLITREMLVDILLISGMIVIFPALIEGLFTDGIFEGQWVYAGWDTYILERVRVGGVLVNPNNLSAFILLIIPLLIQRQRSLLTVRGLLNGVYLMIALLVLVMSYSRGAMIGLAVAVFTAILIRVRIKPGYLLLLFASTGLIVFLITLYGDNTRAAIYDKAVREILQHPLTGTGLFTFRIQTPFELDAGGTALYAHNLFLHVTTELGIPGGLALVAALVALLLCVSYDDRLRRWAYAAVWGTIMHQMVDFPVMMPVLALVFVVVLALAIPPLPKVVSRGYARVVGAAAVGLIMIGVIGAPLIIR